MTPDILAQVSEPRWFCSGANGQADRAETITTVALVGIWDTGFHLSIGLTYLSFWNIAYH